MTCAACIAAGQSAKAESHRNWRTGWACFGHAAVDWDEFCASSGYVPDEASIRAAAKQMRIPYVGPEGPLPTQSDLFGASA